MYNCNLEPLNPLSGEMLRSIEVNWFLQTFYTVLDPLFIEIWFNNTDECGDKQDDKNLFRFS